MCVCSCVCVFVRVHVRVRVRLRLSLSVKRSAPGIGSGSILALNTKHSMKINANNFKLSLDNYLAIEHTIGHFKASLYALIFVFMFKR